MAGTFGDTALFGQVAGAGNREDLVDVITLLDPYETPFYSLVNKGTASFTTHEWQTESLQTTATGGASIHLEGGAFSADAQNARTRILNACQIFRKDIQVSNTQRAVRPAGIRDEYLHQIQIAIKELGRDIEGTLLQGAATSATGGSAAARRLKPVKTLLTTNDFTTSSTAIGATGVGFSGTSWALGENMFNSCLETVYNAGGRCDTVFVNGSTKRQISKFFGAGGAIQAANASGRRDVDQASKKLFAAVDSYESDFGVVNVILDRWVGLTEGGHGQGTANPDNYAFFFQMDTWEIAVLRPLKHIPLPPGGDAVRGMVLSEFTLVQYAEKWNLKLHGIGQYYPTSDGTITFAI